MTKTKINNKYIKSCVIAAALAAGLLLSALYPVLCRDSAYTAYAAEQPDARVFDSGCDTKEGFAYGSGDGGSGETAFLIATPEQLDNIRNYLGDAASDVRYYFRQVADIDLTDFLKDSDAGWQPVGTGNSSGEYFYGVYDGGLFEIKGLWCNRPQDLYTGLFGYVESSKIKNIRLTASDFGITGGEYVGGIAGEAVALSIESCSVAGLLKANGLYYAGLGEFFYLGGLIGYAYQTVFSGCRFFGTLADDNGYRNSVDIEEGEISERGIGGIAGCLTSYSQIVNSYAKVSVTKDGTYGLSRELAGLCGTFGMGENKIENCFTLIDGENPIAPFTTGILNGLISWQFFRMEVSGSYYFYAGGLTPAVPDIDEDVFRLDVYSRGLTAGETSTKSAFLGKDGNAWDFTSVWGFDRGGNILLRVFGGAYDPPAPVDLTWLYILLPCLLFAAAVIVAAGLLYRRKKTEIVAETVVEIQTVEVPVEVIKEVPISQGVHLPMDIFTPSEKRIAELLLLGKSRRAIAAALHLSENTVRNHTSNIFGKAEVESQTAFIAKYLNDISFFET